MQSLPNIERSAFRRGEYVGYANGVWRISRGPRGWFATKRDGNARTLYAPTLRLLSIRLDHFANTGIADCGFLPH
jgi:hypothetical protein